MKLARVVGTVVATAKDPSLQGHKILLIEPVTRKGHPCGSVLLALDSVGAGFGECVFYVTGKEGSFPWYPQTVASDCSIVGILDEANFEGGEKPAR